MLTHIDDQGRARMVDVNAKPVTHRSAVARAQVVNAASCSEDVLDAARVAGMGAAKRTSLLIPLCHPIPIDDVRVAISQQSRNIDIEAEVTTAWKTGVEMEALTAVTVTALTIVSGLTDDYHSVRVEDIAVWSKQGGKSGTWGRSA